MLCVYERNKMMMMMMIVYIRSQPEAEID